MGPGRNLIWVPSPILFVSQRRISFGPGDQFHLGLALDLIWAWSPFSFGHGARSHLGGGQISFVPWARSHLGAGPDLIWALARTHLGPGSDLNWARGPISDGSRVRITLGPGPIVFGYTRGHNFSKCLDGINHCNCRLQAHHTCLTSLDMKISNIPTISSK